MLLNECWLLGLFPSGNAPTQEEEGNGEHESDDNGIGQRGCGCRDGFGRGKALIYGRNVGERGSRDAGKLGGNESGGGIG